MNKPNWRKYHKMLVKRNIFKLIYIIGTITLIIGLFYILGISGQADMEGEVWYTGENWSIFTYFKHTMISFILIGVGTVLSYFGNYFNNLAKEWLSNFENKISNRM